MAIFPYGIGRNCTKDKISKKECVIKNIIIDTLPLQSRWKDM
jgi:hypothetical protein